MFILCTLTCFMVIILYIIGEIDTWGCNDHIEECRCEECFAEFMYLTEGMDISDIMYTGYYLTGNKTPAHAGLHTLGMWL